MIFGGLRLQKTDMIDGLVVVRPHGGLDRRVVAVLLHEEVGAAVDVEVVGHRPTLFYVGLPQSR